jgi:hypothetical protein
MRRILVGTTAELLVVQNCEKIDAFKMGTNFRTFPTLSLVTPVARSSSLGRVGKQVPNVAIFQFLVRSRTH